MMDTVALSGSRITPGLTWARLSSKVSDGSSAKSDSIKTATQSRELSAENNSEGVLSS